MKGLIGSELSLIERLKKMQGMGDYQLAALMDGVGPRTAAELERLLAVLKPLTETYAKLLAPLPEWEQDCGKADHAFAQAQTLPFTVWETQYEWADADQEVLADVKVVPLTVTAYDILPGAGVPTVEYRRDGHRARSCIDMFYRSEADARAEAEFYLAVAAQQQANEEFDRLTRQMMPQLMEATSALSQA